jgi:ABC-2 type transport system ATP-binding protein
MSEILAEVTQLHRRYSSRIAVERVDFTLARGDVLGLLGPNGAGKSTTLRMLTGNLLPTAGHIRICGHNMIDTPRAGKRHLGYLPEHPPLYTDFTVSEFLLFCGKLHGITRENLTQAVDATLEQCQLGAVRHRVIGNLSKGYQQRVGVAQAIIHRPDIIVLDEPSAGLDPHQIMEMRSLIQTLRTQHAMVISSHILPEIAESCNRVLILHHGQQVWCDHLNNLTYDQNRYVLRFAYPVDFAPVAQQLVLDHHADPHQQTHYLTFTQRDQQIPLLMRAILEQQWPLLEFAQQRSSLEQLFIEVTCGHTPRGQT